MGFGVSNGEFAHVVGTFDLAKKTGTIDYVTPVKTSVQSEDVQDEGIHLVGTDEWNKRTFDKVVNPQRNSCAPHGQQGTYEEYVPVSPELRQVSLLIDGAVAAEFARGTPMHPANIVLGSPNPAAPHKFSLDMTTPSSPSPGITYTVQAKAEHDPVWQTLAVGMPAPTTEVDVNQFPGAKSVNVRVLRSDGFSESQVFQETKTF